LLREKQERKTQDNVNLIEYDVSLINRRPAGLFSMKTLARFLIALATLCGAYCLSADGQTAPQKKPLSASVQARVTARGKGVPASPFLLYSAVYGQECR
jgi:hypothetical protein